MSECKECSGPVDADGLTVGDCPTSPPDQCEECFACYCDGSC